MRRNCFWTASIDLSRLAGRTALQRQRDVRQQCLRAGVEGTISFLKRVLGLWRCFNKGWEHYVSTIGAAVFTHNLLILART